MTEREALLTQIAKAAGAPPGFTVHYDGDEALLVDCPHQGGGGMAGTLFGFPRDGQTEWEADVEQVLNCSRRLAGDDEATAAATAREQCARAASETRLSRTGRAR